MMFVYKLILLYIFSPFTKGKLLSQIEVETFKSTLTLVKSLPFGKFPNMSLSTDEGNVVD